MTIRAKLNQLRTELKAAFPERDQVVDGLVYAALANEHVFLLGLPGTAKSLLCRVFARALGGRFFDILMTRYTEPNEVFGPIDLQAWSNQGTYGRRTTGFLPTAETVFLDEIWKSNSSILNALLTALNERIFFDDGKAVPLPLRTVVGASNELPEGNELEALFDRFLFRYEVGYCRNPDSFARVLVGPEPSVSIQLSLQDLDQARYDVAKVAIPTQVVDEIFALRATLTAEGFVVSDRRWKKLLTALRAVAWCGGRDTVSIRDFDVVQHSLWRQPADRPKIASIVAKTMAPNLAEAVEVHDGILELVRGLPQTGELGPNGRTVISELKKAIKRTTELSADSQNGIGEMITEMVDRLRGEHEALTKRIMQELGL